MLLLLLPSMGKEVKEEEIITEETDYCTILEEKLEEILPEIEGVGKVSVMVTAKNYGTVKLAEDETEKNKETVILSQKGGGEDAKIIEEMYPEIEGVIIAADGGKSDRIKAELTEAVTALLGVDAHKIKVFERKID